MLFTPLKYYTYKLLSAKIFNRSLGYHNNCVAEETLTTLKQRIKQSHFTENNVIADLSTNHLAIGGNIHEVFNRFGKPAFFKTMKSGGVIHEVVLYKRFISGQKAKVIYNFVNGTIASISFKVSIENNTEFIKVNSFVKETYLNNTDTLLKDTQCLVDAKGNKLFYDAAFDITLTYVNNNPEIIQNINAALYQNRYVQTKYIDRTKFQLQF